MKKVARLWKQYSFAVLLVFLVSGLFDFRIALFATICMIGPVAVSLFKGRFWCGNVCPRGSFYDTLISRISRGKKVPAFLKTAFFRSFVVIVLFTVLVSGIYRSDGSLHEIGFVFYRIIFVTTLIGVLLSLVYNHRVWCNFCPMGTFASIASRLGKNATVLQVSDTCVECGLCEKKCPLNLVPSDYKGDSLSHPDCIQCGLCVQACPKKAIGYSE